MEYTTEKSAVQMAPYFFLLLEKGKNKSLTLSRVESNDR